MLWAVHFEAQRFGLAQPGGASRDAFLRASEFVANGAGPADYKRVVLNSFDLSAAESQLIALALEVTEGNRTRAAELLGLSVRTLRNKLNSSPKS
jgi:DNA-binding NtrC family response regulator